MSWEEILQYLPFDKEGEWDKEDIDRYFIDLMRMKYFDHDVSRNPDNKNKERANMAVETNWSAVASRKDNEEMVT